MYYPSFFQTIPTIQLHDPLSQFLGAFKEGMVEISYLDAVKLAGHSCPTIATAYLMAQQGLQALYPETTPQRGEISVAMREDEEEGVTGVTAMVLSFILGANGAGGFKGIMGNFARNNRLHYGVAMEGDVTLTRLDTQTSVTLTIHPEHLPQLPELKPLMAKALQPTATPQERDAFASLWQVRVEKMFQDPTLWGKLITYTKTEKENR